MRKWLFFDLGSTLLDETSRVNERIAATARRLQIDTLAFREQLMQAAKTHPYAIQMELPDQTAWAPWPKRLDPLYPKVPSLLELLCERYSLGIIANHGKDTARQHGISDFFTVYAASEAIGFKKPDMRIFKIALEQAHCDPANAVMIGDRLDNDIYPAKKLGMETIWIKQGFGGMTVPWSNEYEPDFQVDSVDSLLHIL